MILTLKELAEYLRVNERTITRMQEQGKISGVKIGGQWRFNGSEVDKLFFPGKGEEIAKEMEQSEPQSALSRPLVGIPLSRVMHENRILLNLNATDRDSLIAEMTSARMMYGVVLDAADIRRKCLDRESVLSTAIGEGIATDLSEVEYGEIASALTEGMVPNLGETVLWTDEMAMDEGMATPEVMAPEPSEPVYIFRRRYRWRSARQHSRMRISGIMCMTYTTWTATACCPSMRSMKRQASA